MVLERCIGPEDWRSAVIALLYTDKEKRIEYRNYNDISLSDVVRKIYEKTLVDRGQRVPDQGEGCANQI